MKSKHIFILVLYLCILGCFSENNKDNQSLKKQNINEIKLADQKTSVTIPSNQQASAEENNIFKPFYIYADKGSRENHYIPSGFMPNGKCIYFNDALTENCQSGQTCIKIIYDVACSKQDQKWGGIYWLSPANNWGQRKGGYNLTGAQKLTFWAKGESGGEHIEEFIIGGISGNYPDSDTAAIGPVILSKDWREYTVDLRGKDLSYISGGFAWSTNEAANPNSCIFYLDNIKFQ